MSLFAEYPPLPPRPPRKVLVCCAELDAPGRISERTWAVIHAYGHSRTPVSVAAMAETLGIAPGSARSALMEGERVGWLAQVQPERHERHPVTLWIGRLPHKR
jgi:hypothetical protein